MKLYLMQHGKALSKEEDPERSLSPEGRSETTRMGDVLKEKGTPVDVIWHSGKARAAETAEIIAAAIGCGNVRKRRWACAE